MKRVTLKSLTLTNFKGEKSRTTEFGMNETTISGRNALGKTRHFDAFVWLLFGKDHLDRKDYEVKTRINGEELHKCECSVEGTINVDGEDITLKRSLVEEWVKPRGQMEEVFKGNRTECWWNDVPVRVKDFSERIEGIIKPDVFKMLTNPRYFASMDWKLQREQLFMLAGTITDEEIALTDPNFKALMEKLNGKSFADFRAETNAKKKRLKAELSQVQPRIDQTEKLKPETEDFEDLLKQLSSVEAHIAENDAQIADAAEAQRKANQEEESKRAQIHVLETEQQELVFKARQKAKEQAFEQDSRRLEIEANRKAVERERDAKQRELSNFKRTRTLLEKEIEADETLCRRLRDDWQSENAKEYAGETVCPHCGQYLPEDMIEKSREMFVSIKKERLEVINSRGKEVAGWIGEKKSALAQNAENTAKCEQELAEINERHQALSDTLKNFPTSVPTDVKPEEIPEWCELRTKIEIAKAELTSSNTSYLSDEVKERRKSLQAERTELIQRLAKQEQIDNCDKEIASLTEEGRKLAQQIADLERQEFVASQFTKRKIEECERRINNLFSCVSFRLFEYTQEGNEIETCVPLINGVPYGSANTAGQLNAGLDIINALCRYYGVCAPIIVDNAEAINKYIQTGSQMIYLRVTEDNKLTVTNY